MSDKVHHALSMFRHDGKTERKALSVPGPIEKSSNPSVSHWETVAWIVFCATSVHLAVLEPYLVIIPGERTKVFSGLLCGLSLVAAAVFAGKQSGRIKPLPVIISGVLAMLVILSGMFSQTPEPSSVRGFAAVTSALGGFWCARLLMYSPARQRYYLWFSVGLLSGTLFLALVGNMTTGMIFPLLDSHWHPVANKVILFSVAPLALLFMKSAGLKAMAICLLILSYIVLLLGGLTSGLESAVFIPVVMLLLAVFVWEVRSTGMRRLGVMLAVLLVMSSALGNHLFHQGSRLEKGHISVAYRVENLFLSWDIATQHPWLGNGLLAPRHEYLRDYEPKYPYIDKRFLDEWTDMLRTSENVVLTCLADLGFPFVILYTGVILTLLFMLLRAVFHPPREYVFHPAALLLPIVGALLHYQVLDGMVHPQLSWFFHILLGLVPRTLPARDGSVINRWSIIMKIVLIVGTFAGGLALGGWLPEGFPLKYIGFEPVYQGF
ncbi:MAG: hypothetical protein RDU20_10755 [Desulfomonilaceae bacterium]|nr:hypothetical protein [Desulfomonilaceae bacterium]